MTDRDLAQISTSILGHLLKINLETKFVNTSEAPSQMYLHQELSNESDKNNEV